MEKAMMDELVARCLERGVNRIVGYYIPTEKNKMVESFYGDMGFKKSESRGDNVSVWILEELSDYEKQNRYIETKEG
jgi:predicted enzyme involved in methoxymalonyl-ACP biosynthesis